MFPKARQEGLSVRVLADETLVYDLNANKAHCLNRLAALVWQRCDGNRSPADIADVLRLEQGAEVDEAIVELALEQLGSRDLLQSRIEPAHAIARHSRRDWLKKMAVAMVAMPVVMSLAAPKASAAESLAGSCRGVCTTDADCNNVNPVGRCSCNLGVCNPV